MLNIGEHDCPIGSDALEHRAQKWTPLLREEMRLFKIVQDRSCAV